MGATVQKLGDRNFDFHKLLLGIFAISVIALLLLLAGRQTVHGSTLLHNSVNTGSTKWGGNWGNVGGQYGEIDCTTCHIKGVSNIKRVKTSISPPDASNWAGSGTPSVSVSFLSTVDGSADMGDDSGGHATSNRICEACHSQTKFHRYDTSSQSGGLNHYNTTDCISCHWHKAGFKATCDTCHGYPPINTTAGGPNGLDNTSNAGAGTGSATAGAHNEHVNNQGINNCNTCHYGFRSPNEMPKSTGSGDINSSFLLFGGGAPEAGVTYGGQLGVTYNGVAGDNTLSCNNLYCHGTSIGQTQVPIWNQPATGDCGDCHGATAASPPASPASGISHTTHAGATGRNLSCSDCHGVGYTGGVAAPSGHVDGVVRYDVSALTADYRSGGPASYNGNTTQAATASRAPSVSYSTCLNTACHWNTPTPTWNSVTPATCTTCHNNGTNDGSVDNAAPATGSHALHIAASDLYITCDSCHGSGATSGTHTGHINNVTNFAGDLNSTTNFTDVGGRANTADTCAIICHKDGTWGGTLNWTGGIIDSCTDCHSNAYAGKAGPAVVTDPFVAPSGSHLKENTGQGLPTTAATWKSRCLGCHTKHYAVTAIKVELPVTSWDNPGTAATETTNMRTQLGINYIGADHGGIYLKGSLGADEADACWSCHGVDETINEWGFNADTNGAFPDNGWSGASHNFGTPYTTSGHVTATSAWVTAAGEGYWRKDSYSTSAVLSRQITSVHTANVNAAGISSVATAIDVNGNVVAAAQESRNQIRCSYCHDLHDLNQAVGDTSSGRPYLRGSWMGNPYGPDAPPLSTYNYATTGGPESKGNRFSANAGAVQQVAVPRLFTTTTQEKGGYFIDQNSGWPTRVGNTAAGADKTLAETSGICILCHGSDIDGMDFYGSSMWRDSMSNGHSNSALGGTGANRRNIFDGFRGGAANGMHMAMQGTLDYSGDFGIGIFDGYQIKDGPFFDAYDGAGRTNTNHPPKNLGFYGGTVGSFTQGANGQFTAWFNGSTLATDMAAVGTDGSKSSGLNARAHSFTCSKCHSPHATGLPALLITNCLDSSAGTWSKNYNGLNIGPKATSAWGRIAANNCHRKETWGTAAQNRDTGWHKLAPGQ